MNKPTGKQSHYQIIIEGQLDPCWQEWFDGLTITITDAGHTVLSGPIRDQAALHGLMKKVRNLGIPLLSVNRVEPDQKDENFRP
ncbi:MAG: hypothetical protein IPM53_05295 [Anaerolineaceae bacterium]|nr:hypothetical protein [Anaerolineaceae bacterium]